MAENWGDECCTGKVWDTERKCDWRDDIKAAREKLIGQRQATISMIIGNPLESWDSKNGTEEGIKVWSTEKLSLKWRTE